MGDGGVVGNSGDSADGEGSVKGVRTVSKRDRRRLSPKEHEKRRRLLSQGLSLREVGERCGVSDMAICKWRDRYMPTKTGLGSQCGVPMAQALTPTQQKIAWLGLRIISTAYAHGASVAEGLKIARKYVSGRGLT